MTLLVSRFLFDSCSGSHTHSINDIGDITGFHSANFQAVFVEKNCFT